jgi:signal transduction histidine kinase
MALMAAVVTGAVVLAFCIPLSLFVRSVAYDRAVDGADLQARTLAAELATVTSQATILRLTRQANVAARSTPAAVYLANGQVVGAAGTPAIVPAIVRDGHTATLASAQGGRELWEPVRGPSASVAVMVSVPPGLLTKGVAQEWMLVFGGGLLLVLIAIALADWLGRTIVRPISDLEDVTHRLRDGDLKRRIVPAGPYEVAEVGQAVNELADQIDDLLTNARLAGADLGHRLRTPLTALRLDIEAIADPTTRTPLANDLESLEAAVNRLIRETREPPRTSGHADLAGAVRDRMAFWALVARSQRRRFEVDTPSRRVEVGLDKDDLEAAIDALLSNIFAHTPEGTSFRVGLWQSSPGSRTWTLVVEDDAPTLSVEPSASKQGRGSGTGLGLDIVRRSAERAGGTTEIGRSRSGGFRVVLTLPEWMAPSTQQPQQAVS